MTQFNLTPARKGAAQSAVRLLAAALLAGLAWAVPAAGIPAGAAARPLAWPGQVFLPAAMRSGAPQIGGCAVFPPDHIWNRRVTDLPVDAHSGDYINAVGGATGLHPDFGSGLWEGYPIGIPYTTVTGAQPRAALTFTYASESDPGPYPIPPDAPVEGGSDHHVLVVDTSNCVLYEMWDSTRQPDGSWTAGSGAVFPLGAYALRPDTWTSADAAGLPILPGLVRYDEVAAGEIRHAVRFTAPVTRAAHVWPARHDASDETGAAYPPMGQRFRLKAGVDISGFPAPVRVIFKAFQEYGLILADNGSSWYINGVPDERWDNDMLVGAFDQLTGADFEAVDSSGVMISPDSGQAR